MIKWWTYRTHFFKFRSVSDHTKRIDIGITWAEIPNQVFTNTLFQNWNPKITHNYVYLKRTLLLLSGKPHLYPIRSLPHSLLLRTKEGNKSHFIEFWIKDPFVRIYKKSNVDCLHRFYFVLRRQLHSSTYINIHSEIISNSSISFLSLFAGKIADCVGFYMYILTYF